LESSCNRFAFSSPILYVYSQNHQMRLLSLVLLPVFFAVPVAGQQITGPADSVSSLLCKKWTVVYTEADGRRFSPGPGGQPSMLDFKRDKSVLFVSGGKAEAKGIWAYDKTNKLIRITLGGKSGMTVVQLQVGQLTMLIDTKDATPGDPTPIKMVFKSS